MRRLLESIRDRVGIRQPEAAVPMPPPPPPPPLLPLDRPRPITPPPGSAPPEVAHLGTLARLPIDLRSQILASAFGRTELHLDLRLVPRTWRPIIYDPVRQNHGRGSAPWSYAVPVVKPQDELEWRWYGCVCHRQAPWYRNPRDPRYHNWPHQDTCLTGEALYCSLYPASSLGTLEGGCDYIVGALGWLRTCRQAYLEGIQVLYGTNTFIFESQELLDLLLNPTGGNGHVVLPQHLALIKHVEMRIDTRLFSTRDPNYSGQLYCSGESRRSLPRLTALKSSFPGLKSLEVSFTANMYADFATRPRDRIPELRSALLQPLADAFASFVSTQERLFVVELQLGVFSELSSSNIFAREMREHQYTEGHCWLRYPMSGGGSDPVHGGEEPFYYIKEGIDEGVFWDYQDRARQYGVHWGHLVDQPAS